ncbi:CopG family transcriptional regulator [Bacillus sp. AY1-10]|uniref:CopG family transcriptional regulator n=1 Tax=Bacillus sp. AY1-10 TaxID=2217823 RepID=UPI0011ED755E|nr:CopG family transcriptional regulator [Bacillus sp. AY1-10]KAA0753097.1 CopG family transcriptional regulator [Bacillus sp. AY1-10]
MNLESILEELKHNRVAIVAKKIGISHKKLSKALRAAGYDYKRNLGWHFAAAGEPPLKADIREFILNTDDVQSETTSNTLTEDEVNTLRKLINEWGMPNNVVNEISQQKEKVSKSSDSQKNTSLFHSLYMRIRESGAKEKVSRTVNLDKETCSQLGTFEDVHRLNRDDIIEAALREFFEKYKVQ